MIGLYSNEKRKLTNFCANLVQCMCDHLVN